MPADCHPTDMPQGDVGEPPVAPAAADARIDCERITKGSEADRAAGRLVAHAEVGRRVAVWLRDLAPRRRDA